MEIKQKKVTIMRNIYIACDGTEFMDNDDCIEYEMGLIEKSLGCFNLTFDKTDFDSCIYVYLTNEDDVKKVKQLCEYRGMSSKGFNNPGIYMYNDGYNNKDSWVNLEEILASIKGGAANDQT